MIPNKVGGSYGQDFKVITAPFVKSNLFHKKKKTHKLVSQRHCEIQMSY